MAQVDAVTLPKLREVPDGRRGSDQCGFDQGDARDFTFKFARTLVDQLRYGNYVKLGELGNFRGSCDKNRNLTYRATSAVKTELAHSFRGEFVSGANISLDEEGFAELWLEQNPEDTFMMRDGTTRSNGC